MDEDWWHTSFKVYNEDVQFLPNTTHNVELQANAKELANDSLNQGYFSYIFDRTIDNHVEVCTCPECEFRKFIDSPELVEFFTTLTREPLTKPGEVFISRYKPGQFLGPHHDRTKGKMACTVSLTKDWAPQYGGLLHILEEDKYTLRDVAVPDFNTLTVFSVAQSDNPCHFVSHTTHTLPLHRITCTAWYE